VTTQPLYAIPVVVNDQVRLRIYAGSKLEIEMPLRQRQALVLAAQLLNLALTSDLSVARSQTLELEL
jgi:hypothetical protein